MGRGSGEGKGSGKRRVVDDPVLDEGGKAYLLARDVVKGTSINVNWERLDVIDYIGLGQCLDAGRFRVLPVKGRNFPINIERLIRLTAYGAFNL